MSAEKLSPLPGTRPEGAADEREAAARVRQMFGRIAPRYDFLNHFLSLSLDRMWRRRAARRFGQILRRPEARVLDICCGTGDLAFALEAQRQRSLAPARGTPAVPVPIVGGDFAEPMLERARDKARAGGRGAVFSAADAMQLPFADATFDLVATAFGFRNLANYGRGLREMARVLKPGGSVAILEFTEPGAGPLAGIFRFYFRRILPLLGGAISGSREAYHYLPNSVARFPSPGELAALMEAAGFREVRMAAWNFGSVVLHTATRA